MAAKTKKNRKVPYKPRRAHRPPANEPPEEKVTVTMPPEHKKTIAAQLLGEDRLPDRKIAEIVGISRRQMAKWKLDPEFAASVAHHARQFIQRYSKEGIAQKDKRIAIKNDIHDRLITAIKNRGDHPSMANVPGGETGMVTKTYRGVGKGKNFRLIEEFKIDTPVVKAILELHEDMREELGENKQRFEMTGPDGQPLQPPQINVQFIKVEKVQRHDTDGGVAVIEGSNDETAGELSGDRENRSLEEKEYETAAS